MGLECSDFLNFNDLLLDLNLSPDALRIPIPRHLYEERADDIEARKSNLTVHKAKAFPSASTLFPDLTINDAITILQKAERGRQGKLRAKYMRDLRLEAQREKMMIANVDGQVGEVDRAVLSIQRVYRGFRARNRVKSLRNEDLIFLGMQSPTAPSDKGAEIRTRRKVVQATYADEYIQGLVATKEKIMRMV